MEWEHHTENKKNEKKTAPLFFQCLLQLPPFLTQANEVSQTCFMEGDVWFDDL